ncbi:hypothetical protein MP477_04535 [Chryseobacterium sp. WG23]|uniref:hypothetical protein n=1 Tax=Chryseobacterium sp. WG23 TaxID=2926910 RepID=UPI00211E407E|nr:hypothetical protein [Chryseobacterium sp. WG23]MCQ9634218.1 hypothetical protein [Chryseobacterium sp. WG23]
MKKLFFASVCALTLLSCGREESEIQAENQKTIASLQSKKEDSSLKDIFDQNYIYRYYSNSLMKHYYGSQTGPIGQHNWSNEGLAFKTSKAPTTLYGLALYVNPNNLDMVIAVSIHDRTYLEASGYVLREELGWPAQPGAPGTFPVYRYYRSSKNGHFYTKNLAELGTGGNGWTYEGITFHSY